MLFWLNELPGFLLVLVRLTAFFVAAPLYAHRTLPTVYKIGFLFLYALVIYSSVSAQTLIGVDMNYILLVLEGSTHRYRSWLYSSTYSLYCSSSRRVYRFPNGLCHCQCG